MILILSDPRDAHIPFVTRHLECTFTTIDAGALLGGKGLSYAIGKDGLTIDYEGIDLSMIKSVWYRKPRNLRWDLSIPVEERYQEYSRCALRAHLEQLCSLLDHAFWISDYYALLRANNKMLQLKIAKSHGFMVPQTLLTSSTARAKKFVDKMGVTVTKGISGQWPKPSKENTQEIFFTRLVEATADESYDGLHLAPALFQQAITPAFDVRITVVGKRVFATRIDLTKAAHSEVLDWRIGHIQGMGDLQFQPYALSHNFEKQCTNFVRSLGLSFGALDFVCDKKGKLWFLEINPNGQWAFIEESTRQPIGREIAKLLDRGKLA